jgi:hypothetical protein
VRCPAGCPTHIGCFCSGKQLAILGITIFLGIVVYLAVKVSSSGRNELPLSISAPRAAAMRGELVDAATVSKREIVAAYGKLPLTFEANQGQVDSQVKFVSHNEGQTLFLTDTEMVLALSRGRFSPIPRRGNLTSRLGMAVTAGEVATTPVLRMKLIEANQEPRVEGLEELPGKSNYFIGNDPAKWRTNVSNYAKVEYQAIYPGVDLVYYGNQGQLEHDFIVAPGVDPKTIQLGFQGTEKLRIDAQGDLVLRIRGGEVRLQKPIVYQSTPDNGPPATDRPIWKQFVTARYVLRGNHVGFVVGEYDARKPLIIDPTLSYSTYLGGSSSDSGDGIAVDTVGNAYVTGETSSTDFPTANPFQGTSGGGGDVFVAKLSSSGATLLYSTYLGGSQFDFGAGIAVDTAGNAYVTGQTSSTNFPTKNSFQGVLGSGHTNAFVAKLDNSGSLLYSTYLGGSRFDNSTGVAVGSAGNAYVTGQTSSTDFPTKNPLQAGRNGSSDAFVAKIDTTASGAASLVYSTYLGGSDAEGGGAVAVDSAGDAFVTGFTQSSDFPTANALQAAYGGGTCIDYYYGKFNCADAFVAKLNPAGTALIFSTYWGGNQDDRGAGIAVDSSGNSYVTGHTSSTNFPTSANPIQRSLSGSGDVFVAKLNATGAMLVYSTYLGGSNDDQGNSIASDSSGNAYVTGSTSSTDFPTVFPVQVLNSGSHVFITKLNPAGSALVYSSYLGGSGFEAGAGVAVDATGNAYVTGNTSSNNFPTVNPLQTSLRGFLDAFVSKIAPIPGPALATSPASLSFTPTPASPQPINTTSPPQQVTLTNKGDGPLTITAIAVAGTNGADFAQTNTCGTLPAALAPGVSCAFSVTFTPTATGTRSGMVTISDNAVGSPHTVSVLGNFVPPDFSISVSPNTATVSAGGSATSTLTINALNNFTGSVFLSCSGGLPAQSRCSFSPSPATPGANPATSTLTIFTTANSAAFAPPSGPLRIKPLYAFWLVCLGIVLVGLGIWGRTPKKQRIGYFSVGLLFILVGVQAGCGGPNQNRTGTTPGTYGITVTGRSSSLQHSTTVTLTVQ